MRMRPDRYYKNNIHLFINRIEDLLQNVLDVCDNYPVLRGGGAACMSSYHETIKQH